MELSSTPLATPALRNSTCGCPVKKLLEDQTGSRLLLVPAAGFAVLAVGLMLNLMGWYLFESRAVVIFSLVFGVAGLVIGVFGILLGQILTLRNWFGRRKP